jgi:co-chaperonin GroES (HSP10)
MKKIIPFGDRIIVKRRPIGEKLGSGIIVAAQDTAERLTEIADVVCVPDQTFADKQLIENSERIIKSMVEMAADGDVGAVNALLQLNQYLKLKMLKPGDVVMVGKYTGIDFTVGETGEQLSITDPDGIRGLVIEK